MIHQLQSPSLFPLKLFPLSLEFLSSSFRFALKKAYTIKEKPLLNYSSSSL